MAFEDIIVRPIITEKSNDAMQEGKYTFKVAKNATKPEIAKAVEKLFNVKVESVNTINVRPKKKRVGRYPGKTNKVKKAIVTLKEGSSIELN